jgi:hypothetical protein
MAVGDGQWRRAGSADQQGDSIAVVGFGNGPHPMRHAIVVDEIDVRRARRDFVEHRRGGARGVLVEQHHRRGVDAGGPEQPIAVLAGAHHRALVTPDAGPGLQGLQPEPPEEPALDAQVSAARRQVRLLVDID